MCVAVVCRHRTPDHISKRQRPKTDLPGGGMGGGIGGVWGGSLKMLVGGGWGGAGGEGGGGSGWGGGGGGGGCWEGAGGGSEILLPFKWLSTKNEKRTVELVTENMIKGNPCATKFDA